jgi:hypothetical protein
MGDRRTFLGLIAAGAAAGCDAGTGDAAPAMPRLPTPSGSLLQKGINYDVGIPWAPDFNSREVWLPELVTHELRTIRDDVGLLLGCELTIFMSGLVPGASFEQRALALGTPEADGYDTRLNTFLAEARSSIRPVFRGALSY